MCHHGKRLASKSRDNKYADDTNLLVPKNTNCILFEEFEDIKAWATDNKMVKICSKLKNSFSIGHTLAGPICH